MRVVQRAAWAWGCVQEGADGVGELKGCGDGLALVTVKGGADVDGAGHDAAAVVVAGDVVVVVRYAVFGIGVVAAWVVHEVVIADGNISAVERACYRGHGCSRCCRLHLVAAAVASDGEVAEVGAIGVVACQIAFSAVVWGIEDVVGNLCLL